MEENNLTRETKVTLQGIYRSQRAWENGHNIEKLSLLCFTEAPY